MLNMFKAFAMGVYINGAMFFLYSCVNLDVADLKFSVFKKCIYLSVMRMRRKTVD